MMMNLNWTTSRFIHLRLLLLIGAALLFSIEAFAPSDIRFLSSYQRNKNEIIKHNSEHVLMAKKKKGSSAGKGFGTKNNDNEKFDPTKKKTENLISINRRQLEEDLPELSDNDYTTPSAVKSNAGQMALESMRRNRAEQKDAELRKVKTLVETDQYVKESGPGAAAIPEKVAQRMGKRMLPFVGIPLFGVMGTFVTFWYLATYKDIQFQTGLVATSTIVVLLLGLLGITYSVMSASWDIDREGSLLGVDEFQKNLGNIKSGLTRSKENLLIRERMAGLPELQITKAIDDLDRRDARQLQKQQQQSLDSKLEKDLE